MKKVAPSCLHTVLVVILASILSHQLSAQIGVRDSSYEYNRSMGLPGRVTQGLLLPDSTLLVVGSFQSVNDEVGYKIAKLKQDGRNDASFNPGTGSTNDFIYCADRQVDGKFVVGGGFTQFNSVNTNRFLRLNADGSRDNGFSIGTGFNGYVREVYTHTDTTIIACGAFSTYRDTSVGRIIRLTPNGNRDVSFNTGSGANAEVYTMAIQPDGKYIVAGNFTAFNGTTVGRIVRLNTDGSIDTTFNSGGAGANNAIYTVRLLPTGKIMIVGDFTSVNGTSGINRICRLNADGSRDSTFSVGTGFNAVAWSVMSQADGKIIVAGNFTAYKGSSITRIIRIDTTGNRDNTFNPGTGLDNFAIRLFLNYDGKAFACGAQTLADGFSSIGLTRFNANGSVDTTFMAERKLNGSGRVVLQSTGKAIVVGDFTKYNATTINRIARFNKDGSFDNTFILGTGFNGAVNSAIVLPDDKILVGGAFTQYNGVNVEYLARLHVNGTLDTSFYNSNINGAVNYMDRHQDGRIYIGGEFATYSGTVNRITRLKPDGTRDSTFNSGSGFNNEVFVVKAMSGNRVLAGGPFTQYNGVNQTRIVMLDSTGTVDTSFHTGTGFAGIGGPTRVYVQPDGKIVLTGQFTSYNGAGRDMLIRLNANGTNDAEFNSSNNVYVYQSDRYINGLIPHETGYLTGGNSGNTIGLRYVNSSGVVDMSNFPTSNITYSDLGPGIINWLAVDSINGRILMVGSFTTVQNRLATRFAALVGSFSGTAIDSISIDTPLCAGAISKARFYKQKGFNLGNTFTVQLSDSGGSFASPITIGSHVSSGYGWDSITVNIPGGALTSTHYRIRVVANNPVCTSGSSAQFKIAPVSASMLLIGDTSFCDGDSVILMASAAASYIWSNGATTQSIFVDTPGHYRVTVTTHNCNAITDSIVLVFKDTLFCDTATILVVSFNDRAKLATIYSNDKMKFRVPEYVYAEDDSVDLFYRVSETETGSETLARKKVKHTADGYYLLDDLAALAPATSYKLEFMTYNRNRYYFILFKN